MIPSIRRSRWRCAAAWAVLAVFACHRHAAAQRRADLQDRVGIDQHLDAPLPLELQFRDEAGDSVKLGDYFGDQPVVLTPVYYQCPMLCGLELNGLVRCLKSMQLSAGKDFQIVTFSIDPKEGPDLAAKKKQALLRQYDRAGADAGWHFLTGDAENVQRLCEALGFRTVYNPETGQYAHAAGIMAATPQGRLSRYFYGVDFIPGDLRLGLVEASQNRIGTLTDHVLLYCYLYDPVTGRYGLAVLNLVRAGGVLTVLAMAVGILWMLRRERLSAVEARELTEGDETQ